MGAGATTEARLCKRASEEEIDHGHDRDEHSRVHLAADSFRYERWMRLAQRMVAEQDQRR